MSSWSPTKYKTKNWPSYNAALKQRGSLSIWFDPEIVWEPPPSGKRGRQQSFSDAAIQARLTLKVLFGLPLRQTTWFVQSLLKLAGLDWLVPDYSTLSRRQKALNVSLPYRGGTGALNLPIDSTGIKSEGEGEWNACPPLSHMPCMCCRAAGGPKRRIWRKIHIGADEKTLEVRAVEVTTSNVGDAPMLPELLSQIPPTQDIGSVTAPLGSILRMRLPGSGRRLRYAQMSRCDCHPQCLRRHTTAQECQAVETYQPRSHRP